MTDPDSTQQQANVAINAGLTNRPVTVIALSTVLSGVVAMIITLIHTMGVWVGGVYQGPNIPDGYITPRMCSGGSCGSGSGAGSFSQLTGTATASQIASGAAAINLGTSGSLFLDGSVYTGTGAVPIGSLKILVVNKTVEEATPVTYTCAPGLSFMVIDGRTDDQTYNITLQPSSGGFPQFTPSGGTMPTTFVMNASIPAQFGESHSVWCDASGNSWVF